jgi:hypothetical protein
VSLPLITRPANFPPPVARTAGQYGRRALFREPEDAEASSGESSEDEGIDFEATVILFSLLHLTFLTSCHRMIWQ